MQKKILSFWLISLLIKLVLSYNFPMSADEAYYWVWSKHLQLSYLDHPPFVAWLIRLGHMLEPWGNAVRWPAVIFLHSSFLFWWAFLKNYLNPWQIFSWLILCTLHPLLGLGSIVVTPDLPLMFFWASSVYFFDKCLTKNNLIHWVGLGLSLGLGFSSKYHIVLFILATCLYLLNKRVILLKFIKKMHILIICFFISSISVWLWNFENNFSSFKYQLNHGFTPKNWTISWFLEYLIGQSFLIGPLFMPFLFRALPILSKFRYANIQKNILNVNLNQNSEVNSALSLPGWVWFVSLFPFAFFMVSSLRSSTELNWTIIAFPTLFALIISRLNNHKLLIKALILWLAPLLLIIGLMIKYPEATISKKIHEGKLLMDLYTKLDSFRPLYVSNYQMASLLSYSTKTLVPKLPEMSRSDFFDNIIPIPSVDRFFLIMEPDQSLPFWVEQNKFHKKEIKALDESRILVEVFR